ncbi:MAG: arylsulfatase [Opitutae bacterium]|nr:arylsulfatase [Opitutae bacterium]
MHHPRPVFTRRVLSVGLALLAGCALAFGAAAPKRPNVVLIVTDDQGFAELGVTGNPVIRTPSLDRFAAQGVSLSNFHVMPVCSPTRAGMLTGRYYYRTGVTDTWLARSLLDEKETTLPELFVAGGYRTGIFGKWHLGDNYPRRAMDRGFQESLVLNGGGLAQPGDPPDLVDERGAYFNATLRHNGAWVKTQGYVSDVITDAALAYITQNRAQPFFVYLAFNCPHSPHQVAEEYRRHYPAADFDPARYPKSGHPMATKRNPEALARVYGMVENIDDNVGRLLARLDELKLADDTLVIFLSDNGCQNHNGYNGGYRGGKGTTFEGGIHQFCFLRWPARLKAGAKVERITSHIDLLPTLAEFCALKTPAGLQLDGRSLAPLLTGDATGWPERTLFAQWHRGAAPERYRACAVRTQNWKLVQPLGNGEQWGGKTDFQLYDMARDPQELHNVAADNPERVAELKRAYDAWFDDVTSRRDYRQPQRIHVGTPHENPVLLTRQDWSGPKASWGPGGLGHWELRIVAELRGSIRVRFDRVTAAGTEVRLACADVTLTQPAPVGAEECVFADVRLPAGDTRLEATLQTGAEVRGVKYAELLAQ